MLFRSKCDMQERLKAFKEFKVKWGMIELDEEIEYMEYELGEMETKHES